MPFEKGHKLAKGRPLGSSNVYTRTIKDVVLETFALLQNEPGADLLSWGKENPTEFYKIAARLIPTQIEASIKLTNGIPLDAWLKDNDTGTESV